MRLFHSNKPSPSVLRKALFLGIYCVYIAAIVWVGARLFWKWQYDVPMTARVDESAIWRSYFPELDESGVLTEAPGEEGGHFDVLLLGGSVLEQTAEEIERQLRERVGDRLRVYNLARSAHTTRDTFLKFSQIADRPFDLVVIYHGINDARMNCAPPEQFCEEYTHCVRYRALADRLEAGRLTLRDVAADTAAKLIALGEPDGERLDFGAEIRTAGAFRNNLEGVIEGASAHRQTTVVLMPFAWHLPDDYSAEDMQAGRLDYGPGRYQMRVETWGRPENVVAAIEAHNAALEELADANPEVLIVEQAKLMPRSGRYFSDICHFTETGERRFAEQLVDAVAELVIEDCSLNREEASPPDSSYRPERHGIR